MTFTIPIQNKHLIIGGTTKAATTSLYFYLSDHPQVNGSTLKETRFFLDLDYPISPIAAKWTDGIEKYQEFFPKQKKGNSLHLEASPDYLYSVGTPQRIKQLLPDAKIVFLLREPISRIISWYKFARQSANISPEITFDQYIENQLESNYRQLANQQKISLQTKHSKSNLQLYFLSALEQGCYSSYIKHYFDTIGRDNVYVAFYEDLCQNPQLVLEEICLFAKINPDFYSDYTFQIFNRSGTMKNASLHGAYGRLRTYVRKYTHNLPIHYWLRQLRKLFDSKVYYRLNSRSTEQIKISPEIETKLKEYYQAEIQTLENLLGYSVPWYKV
ncbi:MAG: sulfotransferase [Cyanobacteria bacterium P01_A01_bin.83]